MTIADSLEITLQTKNGLKSVIEDNGKTAPTKFSEYPKTFDNIIDTLREQIKITDRIVINADTTLEQLDNFFEYVPNVPSGSSTTTQDTAKVIAANLNVRADGNGSANYLGVLVQGDIVNVYGTASSGWYKINQWRNGTTGNLVDHGTTYGYISNNTNLVTFIPGTTTSTKKIIDISATDGTTVQNKCNYLLAQSKNWDIIFADGYGPNSGSSGSGSGSSSTETIVEYSFNNYFTENYKNSSYTSFSNNVPNVVRQGYWSGYYYYKGNFAFTSSRLTEIKNLLTKSTVKSIQIYVERASTNNGATTSTPLYLYASDSKGTNADVAVNTSAKLTRGSGVWTTLSTDVVNGFKTGKYDHFEVYYPNTSISYYMTFNLNAKLKITYTA